MARATKQETHERIVSEAAQILYLRGLNGVSVDELCSRLGITKPTFYNHFPSREKLVEEVVRFRDDSRRASFPTFIAGTKGSPSARMLAVFDWLLPWAQSNDFRGCPLANAAIETVDAQAATRRVASAHKRWMREELERFARDLGFRRPGQLAKGIMILVEGAVLSAYVEDDAGILRDAKAAAKALLQAHLP